MLSGRRDSSLCTGERNPSSLPWSVFECPFRLPRVNLEACRVQHSVVVTIEYCQPSPENQPMASTMFSPSFGVDILDATSNAAGFDGSQLGLRFDEHR